MAEQLQSQLDKIRQADPFRTLDVPVQVDGEGVRRAYLTLTKRFHPNRFALEPAPTRDVANEVFLLIRRAYDLLADDEKRKQWRERMAPPGPSNRPSNRVATAPPVGAPPAATSSRVPTVAPAPAAPPSRLPTSVASPPPPATGRPSGTVPTVPAATPAGGSRPPQAAGATAPPRTPTLPRAPTMPGTPPPTMPTRRPMASPSPSIGAKPEEVQAMLEAARTRGQRFEDAVTLISRGKFREAREALYKIAMEDPQAKRYRVQLHYAWGLEHLADGKLPEGIRELERALALEPESADIKAALTKAQDVEKQQKKPSGILGKLFGR